MERQRRATAWISSHPRALDAAIAVFVGAVALLTTAFLPVEGSERSADALAYVLALGGAVTLLWRRTHPLVVLPVASGIVFLYWIYDYVGATDLVLWIVFYTATRHGGPNRRRVWQVVGLSLLGVLSVATVGVIVPTEDLPMVAVVGLFFIHGTAAAIGEAMYQRSQYVSQLEQRAAVLEADLESKTALAAVEERTRIAREMHDIIAHGMSAIVVQAQGAQRLVDSDPAKAKDVLRTIESIGRNSSDEMRRMLGVLRHEPEGPVFEPQPTIDDLDALGAHTEASGVPTTISVVGEPRPLPPGLELTVYRVVQEALTNVVRHAGRPVEAHATVTFTPTGVDIHVVDDGLGAAASGRTAGTGHGITGMQERIEIYNGSFFGGPRGGGGYEVRASLPVPASIVA